MATEGRRPDLEGAWTPPQPGYLFTFVLQAGGLAASIGKCPGCLAQRRGCGWEPSTAS